MEPKGEKEKDCLPCRLVGGGGLTGAGLYVAAQASKQASLPGKAVVALFAGGLLYTGIARLLDLPPFADRKNSETD